MELFKLLRYDTCEIILFSIFMKKKLIIAGIATLMSVPLTFSQQFPEKLNRGAVIMIAGRIPYLSWRSFSTDSPDMYFDIYRDAKKSTKYP